MKLESLAFENREFIPAPYTCDGENVNPELRILEVSAETKSLVLIVEDPDAPSKAFVHWTVWNINPRTKIIPRNSVPEGSVEGLTNFGRPGYGGPCPPSGTHRYYFKVFALDKTLDLHSSASREALEQAMEGHLSARGELMGRYQQQ